MIVLSLVAALSSADTDARYQVGSLYYEYDPTYGPRIWKYVKNTEASTAYAAGTVVMNATTTTTPGQTLVAGTSVSVHRVAGVAQHAIAAGMYGWILVSGLGLVLADTGGFTADTGLIPGNAVAGRADDVSGATAAAFALALATTAATATGICRIACPLAG